MAIVKFYKVSSLPATLQADAFYYVENGSYAESYITNSSGVGKSLGNSAMINALINAALSDFNALEIVPDITARNALVVAKQRNLVILVTDATGDSTVSAGAALYAWSEVTQAFTKLTEYESMDVVLRWQDIQGRPSSLPAQLDDAVAKAHTHGNKASLDKIGEDGEGITFGGSPIYSRWHQTSW